MRFVVDFCAQGCFLWFLRDFSSIFHEKSMKNQRKKGCIFSPRRSFFSTWRPLRNTVKNNTKATFSFFVFFPFCQKNIEKMTSKCKEQFWTQKSSQSGPRGSILGPKMLPNSRRWHHKYRKWCKKLVFWPSRFSNIFWHGFELDFGLRGRPLTRIAARRPYEGPGSLQPNIAAQYIYD